MKKRPNATPSGPAGHSRQAFQGGTYSLMLTAAVLALLIVINMRQSRDEKRREAARREKELRRAAADTLQAFRYVKHEKDAPAP